jgi:diacylglycerol kinase
MNEKTPMEQAKQAWRYWLVAAYAAIMISLVWIVEIPEWLALLLLIGFAVLIRILASEILIFGNFLPRSSNEAKERQSND